MNTEGTVDKPVRMEGMDFQGASPKPAAGITCGFQLPDNSVGAKCTFPGPTLTQYRAWATCSNGRVATGTWFTVNSGSWSWANCGRNVFVVDYGVDLR